MTKLLALPLAFCGGIVLATFAGCTGSNENHCGSKGGDAYCQDKLGLAAGEVYCTNNCGGDYDFDGCLVASEPPAQGCWLCDGEGSENCGGTADTGTETETATTMGSESSSESMTDTATETGPMPCMGPEDCADPQPFCAMSGDCVACDGMPDPDAACMGADATLPVCVGTACVACAEGKTDACTDTTPICNTATNTCEGCTSHDQCPDTACNLDAGNCIDPSAVVHVDGDFQNCVASDGSESMPFCTVGAALAQAGQEVLVILHERDGQSSYQEANTVTLTVGIFGAVGEDPILQGFNNNPALTVSPTGNLMLRDVQVSNGPAEGLSANGGKVWLESIRVLANADAGILIDNGSAVIMEATMVLGNSGGGVVIDGGGTLVMANTFVGGDINDRYAVDIIDGTATVIYSTVVAGFGTAAAIHCGNMGADSQIRNSILIARTNTPEVSGCGGITIAGSALESALQDNVALGGMDTAWFVGVGINNNDFHLTDLAPGALATAATWQAGDPPTDIDGDLRPTVDGSADFAGADVP